MGDQQEIETLISEEAFLFGMFLRGEKTTWHPRTIALSYGVSMRTRVPSRKAREISSDLRA